MNALIYEDMYDIANRWDDKCNWLNGKSILITGASGMLASYLVYFCIYKNEYDNSSIQIYVTGRNKEKIIKRFGKYCDKKYFHIIITDLKKEISIDSKLDYIIHAASMASPQYYAINPVETLLPNTLGMYNLMELAKRKQVESFLYFSSGDVYGKMDGSVECISEEDSGYLNQMDVRSCYGESKRMGENMCKAYFHEYAVKANSVRIYHTYGPTMDIINDHRLFSEFVSNIVNNENIIMKSDGKAIRSFCYIADALDAFLRILRYGSGGEAYNMCNNKERVTVKELAELLVSIFPEKNLKVITQIRENNSNYLESPVKYVPFVSVKKLNDLGWNTRYSLKEGFYRTVQSFEC